MAGEKGGMQSILLLAMHKNCRQEPELAAADISSDLRKTAHLFLLTLGMARQFLHFVHSQGNCWYGGIGGIDIYNLELRKGETPILRWFKLFCRRIVVKTSRARRRGDRAGT